MDWRYLAAFRSEDTEVFFPICNTGPAPEQIEIAKARVSPCLIVAKRMLNPPPVLVPVAGAYRSVLWPGAMRLTSFPVRPFRMVRVEAWPSSLSMSSWIWITW